jgi:hypothetical protein
MPAACSHALTALTGHVVTPRARAIVTPWPSWSVFDRRMVLEAVLGFLEVGNVEGHELGPAKRACEAQQQQRAVAEALEAIGSGKGHGAGGLGQDGRFAGRGCPYGAADAAERGAYVLGIGRRLQVGEPMRVADRSAAAHDRRRAGSSIGLVREECRDRGRARREGADALALAPLSEHGEVAPVGNTGALRLLAASVAGGGLDVLGRQREVGSLDREGRKGGHFEASNCRRQARLLSRERIVQMRLVVRLGLDEFITSLLARARRRFARFGSRRPVCAACNRLQARDGVFKFADLVFRLVNAQTRPLLFYLKPEG